MSSIIRNRNGVIEVSLGSSKPAHWRRPLQGYPQLRRQRGECTPLRRSRSVQRPLCYSSFHAARSRYVQSWDDLPANVNFSLISAAPNLGTDTGDLPALIAAIQARDDRRLALQKIS